MASLLLDCFSASNLAIKINTKLSTSLDKAVNWTAGASDKLPWSKYMFGVYALPYVNVCSSLCKLILFCYEVGERPTLVIAVAMAHGT